MNFGACIGYQSRTIDDDSDDETEVQETTNEHDGESCSEKQKYQLVLKCLNNDHHDFTMRIEYMEDYCNFVQRQENERNTFSQKWIAKINQQSSLSSYHTTKRAQIQMVTPPESLPPSISKRCQRIQVVITLCRKSLDTMYPKSRLNGSRKHYQSDEIQLEFEKAYVYLNRIFKKLQKLRKDGTAADQTVLKAMRQQTNAKHDDSAHENAKEKADECLENKKKNLTDIQKKITETEEEYGKEQKTYRKAATVIYEKCRNLEEAHLKEIHKLSIDFAKAMHCSKDSAEEDRMYEELLAKIKSQDIDKDLNSWARQYGITRSPSLPKDLNNEDQNGGCQGNNRLTTASNTRESKKKHRDEEEEESN